MKPLKNYSLLLKIILALSVLSVSSFRVKRDTISKEWKDKKADIYFLVDSSSTVYTVDYRRRMLKFISDLVSGMDIGPDKTRVGVGLFSTKHKVFLPLDNNRSKESLVEAILDTPYYPGNGYLSRAIDGLRREGLSPRVVRKDVPHIAVLFTDGESRYQQLTRDNATLAKKEGIFMFTVGIGREIKESELRNIANDPKRKFAFTIPDFRSFGSIEESLMRSLGKVEKLQGDKSSTCGNETKADVVFVYDEYAMGRQNSLKVKEFIKGMAKTLSMNSGNVRIGINYKSSHVGDIKLGQFVKREALLASIDKDDDGPTINTILSETRLNAFSVDNGARSESIKRIVVVVYGEVDLDTFVDNILRIIYYEYEVFILNVNHAMKEDTKMRIAEKAYILDMDSLDDLAVESGVFVHFNGKKFVSDFCLGIADNLRKRSATTNFLDALYERLHQFLHTNI